MRPAAASSEGLAKDLPGKAAAVAFSMACQQRSCQAAGGDALDQLAGFRRDVYRCLWRRADALFETMDAVLTAGRVPSLPYLSLDAAFRRGHGMVYQVCVPRTSSMSCDQAIFVDHAADTGQPS
jgi:hypothetical protein